MENNSIRTGATAVPAQTQSVEDIAFTRDRLSNLILESSSSTVIDLEDAKKNAKECLSLVKQFPFLAAESFPFGDESGSEIFPLWFLVLCNVNLEQIKEGYACYPDAVADVTGNERPLQLACRQKHTAEGVIAFLAEQYPASLMMKDVNDDLPLHVFLKHSYSASDPYSLKTVEKMVDLYPESLLVHGFEGVSTLNLALALPLDAACLYYLFDNVPKYLTEFEVCIDAEEERDFFSYDQAKAVGRLLPQLEIFDCVIEIHVLAFRYLLDCIGSNLSITNLTMHLPITSLGNVEFDDVEYALENMLTKNNAITTIRLKDSRAFDGSTEIPRDRYIEALRVGLGHNETIQEVILETMVIKEAVLGQFLSSSSVPRKVKLHDIHVEPAPGGERWISTAATEACRLVELEIRFYRQDNPEWLVDLLEQLETMRHLSCLRIRSTSEDMDVTEQLVAILRRNVLQSLGIVCGLSVDIEEICNVLETNTSLKHYDVTTSIDNEEKQARLASVLEHYNTTLQQVGMNAPYVDKECRQAHRIRYLTALNSSGRSRVSDPSIALEEFVGLLDVASQRSSFSIVFGLLRCSPGLWSNAFI